MGEVEMSFCGSIFTDWTTFRYSDEMPIAPLLPIFVFFLVGLVLRKSGIVRRDLADLLLRIVFHMTLPVLAFLAVADASLDVDSIFLPFIGFSVNAVCLGGAFAYCRLTGSAWREAGTVLLGSSVANMVFTFPFIVAVLGESALVDAVLFDLGNAVFVASVANSLAIRLGQNDSVAVRGALMRLLRTPLFIALVAAIILNFGGLRVPELLATLLSPIGKLTVPLTIVALGLSFSAINLSGSRAFFTVMLRMVCGLAGGLFLIAIFGLEGGTALVVAVSAAAPIGFSAVTLTAVARLDTGQITAAVSLSVLIGMFSTSAILWLGRAFL
jgi:predicted permease